ncbi:MAG: ABC transporter permease [Actinobacteria bacterium]|nr:ABC transporter permease [Actinomycetota bacterium]
MTATESAAVAPPVPGDDREAARARVHRQRRSDLVAAFVAMIVTIVIALAIGFVILLIVGKDAVAAYEWLLTGPFSRTTRIGRVLIDTTTLTILGLSVAIPFRAGLMSLGAEGQLYMGALTAAVVGLAFPLPPGLGILVPALAAMVAGAIVGFVPGWMKAQFGANELVSSLMLNTVLVRIYGYILTEYLTEEGSTSVASAYLPNESLIPTFTQLTGVSFDQANLAVVLVPILAVAVWLILQRTSLGYEVRMTGSNRLFAAYGGISSRRVIILSFIISGAIAGIAGAHLVQGVNGRALLTLSVGTGFTGIMIAILARNNPIVIPFAAFFYSYLKIGGDVMEQELSVGTEIVNVILALIVLLVTSQFVMSLVKRRRLSRLEAKGQP